MTKLQITNDNLTMIGEMKFFRSPTFNYNFNTDTGRFTFWGKEVSEDPDFSPYGPLIYDMEITTACRGVKTTSSGTERRSPCNFCYKSNTASGKYMTFETFKNIFDKFPHVIDASGKRIFYITQIAFGVDSQCETNPDVWKIFKYCRDNGVIPNLTVADISEQTGRNISKVCGACAVSRYSDKDACYNSVQMLSQKFGMPQVNIHQIVHEGVYDQILETINDIKTDPRLSKLNCILFLALKKKGRGVFHKPLSEKKYKHIINLCLEKGIRIGFDSCSCFKFLKSVANPEKYHQCSESCESTLQSFYSNVDGMAFPCSFTEDEPTLPFNIDLTKINDFLSDVWYNQAIVDVREKILTARKNEVSCFHHSI